MNSVLESSNRGPPAVDSTPVWCDQRPVRIVALEGQQVGLLMKAFLNLYQPVCLLMYGILATDVYD